MKKENKHTQQKHSGALQASEQLLSLFVLKIQGSGADQRDETFDLLTFLLEDHK